MMPEDDATWPVCASICLEYTDIHWCEHLYDYFHTSKDADRIQTGLKLCVPIIPDRPYRLFAEVILEAEIMPGVAPMFMAKAEPFTNDEVLLELGFWTAGEGRDSIASVVEQWVRDQNWDFDCRNSIHGVNEQTALVRSNWATPQDKELWVRANHFIYALFNMCYPCKERLNQRTGANSNFGLSSVDPTVVLHQGGRVVGPGGGVSVNTTASINITSSSLISRQDAIKEGLRLRFGK